MTYQEILESITRHRASPAQVDDAASLERKLNEIEWALQAIAEKLAAEAEAAKEILK